MQLKRIIRTWVPPLVLGLVCSVLGCSSGSEKPPEEVKAFGNSMKADMKNAMKEFRAAKAANKGGMQGKGPR